MLGATPPRHKLQIAAADRESANTRANIHDRNRAVATPRRQQDILRRLARAAPRFDSFAFVHEHTRQGLIDRLAPMTRRAEHVVDLGSATGAALPLLRKRFRGARVHGVDFSIDMLRQQPQRLFARRSLVCADAGALPFVDASIDVAFANQLLSFTDDVAGVCREIGRVLRDDGIFAFALLGPDSFSELAAAWGRTDETIHVARFPDMHNVGDALVRAGLRDPVLDVDRLRLTYDSPAALYRDLTAVGARNSLADRAPGLATPRRLAAFERALFGDGGPLELELELVYGHAFGGRAQAPGGPVRIDPESIRRRR